jgi:hypothetical protein
MNIDGHRRAHEERHPHAGLAEPAVIQGERVQVHQPEHDYRGSDYYQPRLHLPGPISA